MKTRKHSKSANTGNKSHLRSKVTLEAKGNKLRGDLQAAEDKYVRLLLPFLKYVSDAVAEMHAELRKEKDPGPAGCNVGLLV